MYFPSRMNQLLITWFGCGRIPLAPGTAGSVGALPLCWVLSSYTDLYFRIIFACGVTAIAILSSAQDQVESQTKDPGYVVIDEVAGMLWTTLFIPAAWLPMLVAFGIFRVLDITKPFPANLFDRYSKTSLSPTRRGAHIVLDDVIAGIYGGFLMKTILVYLI